MTAFGFVVSIRFYIFFFWGGCRCDAPRKRGTEVSPSPSVTLEKWDRHATAKQPNQQTNQQTNNQPGRCSEAFTDPHGTAGRHLRVREGVALQRGSHRPTRDYWQQEQL